MLKFLTYRIIIEPDENNTYHAYVPTLGGCHSFGDTIDEAKKNIKEAIELYVEDLVKSGEDVPEEKSFDTFATVMMPNPA